MTVLPMQNDNPSTNRGPHGDALTVLGLLLFTALVHWRALTLQAAYYYFDINLFHNPIRHVFAQGFADGRLSLWCPGMYAGFPLFADGQVGALYPFNFMHLPFLSTWQATNLIVVFHFALVSVFMYVYLRSYVRQTAAFVGAVSFAYSGPFSTHMLQPSLLLAASWIPLVFHIIDRAVRGNRATWLIVLAPVLAVQLFAGFVQISAYTFMMALAYAALMTARKARCRVVGLVASAIALAMGLAAVQLVPTLELTTESIRRAPMPPDFLAEGSTSVKMLATFILPDLFGRLADGTHWSSEYNCYETIQYVGIAVLLLAVVGLRRGARRPAWTLAGVTVIAAIMMLGKFSCMYPIVTRVPVLDRLRMLGRFNIFAAFGISGLGALGLDWIAARGRPSMRVVYGFALGVILIAGSIAAHTYADLFRHAVPSGATQLRASIYADAARSGAVLLATLIIFGLHARGHIGPKRAVLGLVLCVMGGLFGYHLGRHPILTRGAYEKPPQSVEFLKARPGGFRAMGGNIQVPPRQWLRGPRAYRASAAVLPANVGLLHGLHMAGGWSSLELRRWRAFTAQMNDTKARLLNVRYLLAATKPGPGRYVQTTSEGTHISEMPNVLPRAFVVTRWDVARSTEDALDRVSAPAFDPLASAVLEEELDGPLESTAGPAKVTVALDKPEHVALDMNDARAGLLVLCDACYPGWKAYVDGRRTRIRRADYLFRAVALTDGPQRVSFVYRPVSFIMGATVSGVAFVAMAVAVAISLSRRTRIASVPLSRERVPPSNYVWLLVLVVALAVSIATRWSLWHRDFHNVWTPPAATFAPHF